ncbi:MAG: glycosyltransferase [Burkholderiales bacterium]|nr:MAG: glycosyltransferase [Burkholderiales bacterium]
MVADCELAASGALALPRIVMSSNGYFIARYHSDAAFRDLVASADIVDADGMPLVLASRMFCKPPLLERVATTDFVHDAAAAAGGHNLRFYFLGARPGVAEKAAEELVRRHDGVQIVRSRHGYFNEADEASICEDIRAARTDVLWVGMGSPMQEAFAVRNRKRLAGVAWIKTCGGLFDHCAGRVPRAPAWMQRFSLEWLHRAATEPRRLGGRYLRTNPVAAYHLLTKTYDVGSEESVQ